MLKIKSLNISNRTQGQWTTTIPALFGDTRIAVVHNHVIDWADGNRLYDDQFKLDADSDGRRVAECNRWLDAMHNGAHVLVQKGKATTGPEARRFKEWAALWTIKNVTKYTGEDGKYGVRFQLDERIAG